MSFIASKTQNQDVWTTQTVEGQIQVLKDTKLILLKRLVRLQEQDKMGGEAWSFILDDLKEINSELALLNEMPR